MRPLASVVLLILIAASLALVTELQPAATNNVSREIDSPALNKTPPPDAVVNVKTAFGAVGDGVTDDTAAIQAAISSGLGYSNLNKTIYFPKGTYLVTKSLEWKRPNGAWDTYLTLEGQNRDKSIIKLKDSSPGFMDPASPKAVIVTASQNSKDSTGAGNEAQNNDTLDLTVDVGAGNAGANGIDFLANNRGAIRNVVVKAPAGSGAAGISMTRYGAGPCLIKDLKVVGFAYGVRLERWDYGVAFENIALAKQRLVGFLNKDNTASVRRLTSNNTVSAIVNSGAGGLLTLLDSRLTGGASNVPAIDDQSRTYVRNVTTAGYRVALHEGTADVTGTTITEFVTGGPLSQFPSQMHSLDLPIAETPTYDNFNLSRWASVKSYGAAPDGHADDTAGIQAALNSGKPVVYFPPGRYDIHDTLVVPPTVRAIYGYESSLSPAGDAFSSTTSIPMVRVTGGASSSLTLSQLVFSGKAGVTQIQDESTGDLILKDEHLYGSAYKNIPGAGRLFLEDVEGSSWDFVNPQSVWARQLNSEMPTTQIQNKGGLLWVLGIKTEKPATAVSTTNGGATEILGGLLYPVTPVPTDTPAFQTQDSRFSAVVSITAYAPSDRYTVLVREGREGQAKDFMSNSAPSRGFGNFLPLFSGAPVCPAAATQTGCMAPLGASSKGPQSKTL